MSPERVEEIARKWLTWWRVNRPDLPSNGGDVDGMLYAVEHLVRCVAEEAAIDEWRRGRGLPSRRPEDQAWFIRALQRMLAEADDVTR